MSRGKVNTQSKHMISLLQNSIYYFIECVYILREKGQYRLIAIHKRTVLEDSVYKTAKGARIAYAKRFKKKAFNEGVKPDWTIFYNPDRQFLNNKPA